MLALVEQVERIALKSENQWPEGCVLNFSLATLVTVPLHPLDNFFLNLITLKGSHHGKKYSVYSS